MRLARAMKVYLATLTALGLASGCPSGDSVPTAGAPRDNVAPTVPAPALDAAAIGSATWDGRGDFDLIISEFHFETGTQIVHIDGRGQIDDVLAAFDQVDVKKFCGAAKSGADKDLCAQVKGEKTFLDKFWRRARYTATDADLDDLRRRLVAAAFPQLDKHYQGDQGDDGVTTTYRLTVAGKTVTVSAYGTSTRGEPPNLLDVHRWLRSQQDAHEAARKEAPKFEEGDYKAQARNWGVTP